MFLVLRSLCSVTTLARIYHSRIAYLFRPLPGQSSAVQASPVQPTVHLSLHKSDPVSTCRSHSPQMPFRLSNPSLFLFSSSLPSLIRLTHSFTSRSLVTGRKVRSLPLARTLIRPIFSRIHSNPLLSNALSNTRIPLFFTVCSHILVPILNCIRLLNLFKIACTYHVLS